MWVACVYHRLNELIKSGKIAKVTPDMLIQIGKNSQGTAGDLITQISKRSLGAAKTFPVWILGEEMVRSTSMLLQANF